MKKIIILSTLAIICYSVSKAQYVNIPDSNFRNFLRYYHPDCFNTAGQMDTTCSGVLTEDSLNLMNNYYTDISSLKYFKGLKYLDCSNQAEDFVQNLELSDSLQYLICNSIGNLAALPRLPQGLKYLACDGATRITSIPSLPPSLNYLNLTACTNLASLPGLPGTLEYLAVAGCSLTALPALPGGLKTLICSLNSIHSFPALPDSLSYFNCSGQDAAMHHPDTILTILPSLPAKLHLLACGDMRLLELPNLPPNLDTLMCGGSSLSTLPAIPSSMLYLDFSSNNITTMPVLPNGLQFLVCDGNPLYTIPSFPDSLKSIYCGSTRLSSLPTLPASLSNLYCSYNQLTSLPGLPVSIVSLKCSHNQLSELPNLPNSLHELDCSYNQLNNLPELPAFISDISCEWNNIYCLPKIPASGSQLRISVDKYKVNCLPNKTPFLTVDRIDTTFYSSPFDPLPLCSPANNANNCEAFPVMQGFIFYDTNNNGIKDAGEPLKSNLRVSLSNVNFSFSNNFGQYEIGADSIGPYNLTASAPRYFACTPSSLNYNFNSYDTLVTGNFALQATSVVDELTIRLTPINWAAKPGFAFPYLISYENTGTTTISPDIVFDYDQLRLSYNTSSVAGVVDNNDVLTYNTGSLSPGESGSFTGFFTLKTTVPLGDTLHAKATITANAFHTADSVQTIVRGAFDPNDKEATPQLSPSQVAAGKYIDYTIRFQNTGTDTAFNIVISDTLNENLQANTLQMLVSSHTCKTTVKDNIVFFEFLNILLPDSNVNELKSHGFVSFRIQPQTTITPNTIIPNKAAIYFDYNAPVITNTAGTLIKDFTVVPLHLVSFSAVPQTDNTTALSWNTANEINTNNFVIEQGSDGSRFNAVSSVAAKGKAYNDYHAVVTDIKEGLVFYRLRIVDNDGRFSYSPIIKIDRRKNGVGFSVLTNPVKDVIILNCTDNNLNHTPANLINACGTVVRSFLMQSGNQQIDVKGLPTGIYYLRTATGNRRLLLQ